MAPKFGNTEAVPGPPFSANVTGRFFPGIVYAVYTTCAMVLPLSSRTGSQPIVTVYFNVWPFTAVVWSRWAVAGNGGNWYANALSACLAVVFA